MCDLKIFLRPMWLMGHFILSRRQIFENPQHPYTKRLLKAVPVMDPERRPERVDLTGDIPSPVRPVSDPRQAHGFVEIAPGHIMADDHHLFEEEQQGELQA